MALYRLLGNPQEITLQATSQKTANRIAAGLVIVRPTVDVFIAIGEDPDAVADGNQCHFIGAGEAFPIKIDSPSKIAAIPANGGTSGKVYLSPIAA